MNITLILDDTVANGFNYIAIKEANKHSDFTKIISLNNSSRVTQINVPVINPSELYHCTGLVIATSLTSFQLLKKSFGIHDSMYYLWNLDYLYKPFHFFSMCNLLNDVVVPSEDYKKIVDRIGNANVCPFDLEKLWNLCKNTKTKS